jgi:progesterone-induced-blocking factor 1
MSAANESANEAIANAVNASSDSVASALGALGSSVPASLRRRLAQSVSLGKRCVELEREARFAREAAEAKAKEVEALELRVRRAESKLDDSNQPYNYLVERISATELEADECRAREKAATETLARARAEASTARAEADALRADLQRALDERSELATIKSMLQGTARVGAGGRAGAGSRKPVRA